MPDLSKVRKAQSGGTGFVVALFLLFAIAGGGMFYLIALHPVLLMIEATSWEPVACVIDSSQVAVSELSEGGSTYRVDIRYSFRFRGALYQGARYDFADSSSSRERTLRIVAAHPAGSETTCYVDPVDPSRSVVDRTPGLFLLWGLFPLLFLAVGLGGLLALSRSSQRRKTRARAAVPSAKRRADGQRLELKATIPPTLIGGFGCTVTAWLVGILIFLSRSADGELKVIVIGFVCVALGLWMGHWTSESFRAFCCLRPRVVLEHTHLELGSVSQAHWRLVGRVEPVRKIAIRLEGREVATYSRGSTLTTDRRVFHSELLVSEFWPGLRCEGVVTLRIPEHTVPSFAAPNSKIEWLLIVTGETTYTNTPDIELPITVRPPAGGEPLEETRP